jgi:hypothetical protein
MEAEIISEILPSYVFFLALNFGGTHFENWPIESVPGFSVAPYEC